MKILVINQHFYPEVAATAHLMTELCADLVELGHEVTVVAGKPSYRSEMVLKSGSGSLIEKDNVFGVNVVRTYNYAPTERTLVRRLFHYLTFFLFSIVGAFLAGRVDVTMVLSTPPLMNGITANILRVFRGIPYVYNVQDLYPDVAVELGVLRSRYIIRSCERLERYLYDHAAKIVVIGKQLREKLLEKGVPADKVEEISNWADTDLIVPTDKVNDFSVRCGLESKFVVQYAGNIGLSQTLESVLQCARMLSKYKDILFLLIGGGSSKDGLQRLANQMNLTNVTFLPPEPRESLADVFASADVSLIPLKRGYTQYMVPSKVFSIMASGRPFIAALDRGSTVWQIVQDSDCGLWVEPENPKALAGAIEKLYHDGDLRRRLGQNGRQEAERRFSRAVNTVKYDELFRTVLAN